MNITFDGNSRLNAAYNLGMNITATLTGYTSEEYIESMIVLTVLGDMLVNGTEVECGSADLDSRSTIVTVNRSGNSTSTAKCPIV